MGRLDKYRIFHKNVQADLIKPVMFEERKVVVVEEVTLEDNRIEVSRPNSAPGLTDFLVQKISDYKREDMQVRLLPETFILLDELLKPIPVMKEMM